MKTSAAARLLVGFLLALTGASTSLALAGKAPRKSGTTATAPGTPAGSGPSSAVSPEETDPCLLDARCRDLYESGYNLSQAEQFAAALDNYQRAYALQAVPWMLVNIGRVQQKMGRAQDAITSFEQFLNSGTPNRSPELMQKAETYLAQAKADLSRQQAKAAAQRGERKPRPLWRLVTGGALLAAGVVMTGIGAWALSKDGQCVMPPQPPVTECQDVFATVTLGAPLIAVGAASLVGGTVLIALPGPLKHSDTTLALVNLRF